MSFLETRVADAWKGLKKYAREITLCVGALAYSGCGGGGGGGGLPPPVDPNPPDAAFMTGSVTPPDNSVTLVPKSYTDERGNTYQTTAAEGQAVLLFDSATTDTQATDAILAQGGSVLGKVPNAGLYLAAMPAGTEMAFITSIRAQPGVRSASLNEQVSALQAQFIPQDVDTWSAGDKKYLELIRAFEGWDTIEQSLKPRFANNAVELAILDIDFDQSNYTQDIAGRVLTSQNLTGVTDTHGFQVATIAGATGDNAGKPAGINWYSPLHLITAQDPAKTDPAAKYSLLERLVEQIGASGAEVVNMSLVFGNPSNNGFFNENEDKIYYNSFEGIRDIIDNVKSRYPAKNFLVVAAAGNDNVPMNWNELKHDNMLVIGAANSAFQKAPYSNYGTLVDVFVPGTNEQGGFPFFHDSVIIPVTRERGTSFAAPIASGLASLIFEVNPTLTGKQVKDTVVNNTKQQISSAMRFLDMYAALTNTPLPPATPAHWAKTYGTAGSEFARSVFPTLDGGYVAAGMFGLVFKVGSEGNIEWQKQLGGQDEHFHSVIQAIDGSYLLAGETKAYGAGMMDGWIIKLNPDGTIAWQKTYGGLDNDLLQAIQQTSDGGFIAAGGIDFGGIGPGDAWVLKIGANGSREWSAKYHGGSGSDLAYAIRQTRDNGFIVAGYVGTTEKGLVMKLTADGTVQWDRRIGDTANTLQDFLYSIEQCIDGGYITAGTTREYSAAPGNSDAWVIKFDASGNVVWNKAFDNAGADDWFRQLIETDNGDYVASGDGQTAIAKLDASGAIAWQRMFGSPGTGGSYALRKTGDGGFISVGHTSEYGAGSTDFWLLKLKPDGTCPPIGIDGTPVVTDISATILPAGMTKTNITPLSVDSTATPVDPGLTVNQQAP